MRTLLVASIVSLVAANLANAQAALLGPGAAYIGGGVSRTETDKLADRLVEHGYPRFGQTPGAITLGGYRILSNHVMLGASDSVDFNSVLDDPQPADLREPVLSRDGLVLDLGGGLELLRRYGRGPLLGLRLGYLFAPFNSSWNSYGRKANGGSDATISGPYARIVVGGAWRR